MLFKFTLSPNLFIQISANWMTEVQSVIENNLTVAYTHKYGFFYLNKLWWRNIYVTFATIFDQTKFIWYKAK